MLRRAPTTATRRPSRRRFRAPLQVPRSHRPERRRPVRRGPSPAMAAARAAGPARPMARLRRAAAIVAIRSADGAAAGCRRCRPAQARSQLATSELPDDDDAPADRRCGGASPAPPARPPRGGRSGRREPARCGRGARQSCAASPARSRRQRPAHQLAGQDEADRQDEHPERRDQHGRAASSARTAYSKRFRGEMIRASGDDAPMLSRAVASRYLPR